VKTYNVGILGFGMIGKAHACGHLDLPLSYDPVPLRTNISPMLKTHWLSQFINRSKQR
jgi:hypothetical protein